MSVTIKYKGNTIASITTDSSKTLKTSGKYCEDDIIVENTKDGITPSGNKALTPSETAQIGIDVTNFATVSVDAIPSTYVGSGVTRKAAATVAPSTSEQTVCASGVYTTGEQKVSAITPSIVGNLDASSFAASIVAAVEGKGITVPDGTLLDGMASLIESIEAGGGGEQSLCYATGTFILESNTKVVDITHNLGRIPSFIFVYYTGTYSMISTFPNGVISDLFATIGKQLMVRTYNKNYMIREYNITNFEGIQAPIQNANETTVRLLDGTQNDFYAQGFEYKWIMW